MLDFLIAHWDLGAAAVVGHFSFSAIEAGAVAAWGRLKKAVAAEVSKVVADATPKAAAIVVTPVSTPAAAPAAPAGLVLPAGTVVAPTTFSS